MATSPLLDPDARKQAFARSHAAFGRWTRAVGKHGFLASRRCDAEAALRAKDAFDLSLALETIVSIELGAVVEAARQDDASLARTRMASAATAGRLALAACRLGERQRTRSTGPIDPAPGTIGLATVTLTLLSALAIGDDDTVRRGARFCDELAHGGAIHRFLGDPALLDLARMLADASTDRASTHPLPRVGPLRNLAANLFAPEVSRDVSAAALDFHLRAAVEQPRLYDPMDEAYPEAAISNAFSREALRLLPLEWLAWRAVRRGAGLETPTPDHPLVTAGLVRLQEVRGDAAVLAFYAPMQAWLAAESAGP